MKYLHHAGLVLAGNISKKSLKLLRRTEI